MHSRHHPANDTDVAFAFISTGVSWLVFHCLQLLLCFPPLLQRERTRSGARPAKDVAQSSEGRCPSPAPPELHRLTPSTDPCRQLRPTVTVGPPKRTPHSLARLWSQLVVASAAQRAVVQHSVWCDPAPETKAAWCMNLRRFTPCTTPKIPLGSSTVGPSPGMLIDQPSRRSKRQF